MTNTIFVTETSPKDTSKLRFAWKAWKGNTMYQNNCSWKKKRKVFCAQNLLENETESVLSMQQVLAL